MNILQKIDGIVKTLIAAFALICLLCTPASATETFTIDPIPDQIVWDEELKVTGTAPPGEEMIVEHYLRKGYCSDAGEDIFQETDNGVKGGSIFSLWAGENSKWWFKASLNDLAPGDYIFAVWKHGDEKNRVVKNLHVTSISGGVIMIEVFEPGETKPVLDQETTDKNSFYSQNTYSTPDSGMNLYLIPDLAATGGIIPKGEFLLIDGKGVPGKEILVWICKKGLYPASVYKKAITLKTGDDGIIDAGNELLSANETRDLFSGPYFIYAISGTEEELSGIEQELSSSMQPENYLKANEDKNPYQQFVMLLEAPWIRFSGATGGSILPEAVHGSVVNFSGTTNLKAGTRLDLLVEPLAEHDSGEFTAKITGIRVNDGDPHTWSKKYDTARSGTGEFIVTIADPQGLANTACTINIYDPAYSVDDLENDSLFVESFRVDPETKDITKEKSSFSFGALPTAVLVFETGLVFLIAACAVVIYKKR